MKLSPKKSSKKDIDLSFNFNVALSEVKKEIVPIKKLTFEDFMR